jgi:hypothetical protein
MILDRSIIAIYAPDKAILWSTAHSRGSFPASSHLLVQSDGGNGPRGNRR